MRNKSSDRLLPLRPPPRLLLHRPTHPLPLLPTRHLKTPTNLSISSRLPHKLVSKAEVVVERVVVQAQVQAQVPVLVLLPRLDSELLPVLKAVTLAIWTSSATTHTSNSSGN